MYFHSVVVLLIMVQTVFFKLFTVYFVFLIVFSRSLAVKLVIETHFFLNLVMFFIGYITEDVTAPSGILD